jgi:hypothetical protein
MALGMLHARRRAVAHRQVGREVTDHAVGHLRSELCARFTEEFARDGAAQGFLPLYRCSYMSLSSA